MFELPERFLSDIVAGFAFGLVAIVLVVLGFKTLDRLTPRCDFEAEVAKGNIAAAITVSAVILGICYLVASVITSIIRAYA